MKRYLGDSVYIEKDCEGEGVILFTENGLPDDPSNVIYLGKQEIIEFNKFIERMKGK